MIIAYSSALKDVVVKNYFNIRWGKPYNRVIELNLLRTTSTDFLWVLIKWYTQRKYTINKKYSDYFMNKLREICVKYMKLCGEAIDDKTKQFRFTFRSLQDIRKFIEETLQLTPEHAKLAWFLKGVFFANLKYVQYKREIEIQQDGNIIIH